MCSGRTVPYGVYPWLRADSVRTTTLLQLESVRTKNKSYLSTQNNIKFSHLLFPKTQTPSSTRHTVQMKKVYLREYGSNGTTSNRASALPTTIGQVFEDIPYQPGLSCHVRSDVSLTSTDVSLTSPDVRTQVIWRSWRSCGNYNSLKICLIHFKFCAPSSSEAPRKQGMSHIQPSSKKISENFIWRKTWRNTAEMMLNKGLQEDDI